MSTAKTAILLLVLCLAAGCQHAASAEMTRNFGGSENLRVLRTAADVSVYRIMGPLQAHAHPDPGVPTVAGYRIVAGPVNLDPAASRRLAATLLDPDTYAFDVYPACIFNPGYVARFAATDGPTVDLAFCFGCSQLAVVRPPSATHVGFLTIMPGSDRLLAQLKPLFPADSVAVPR